MADHAIVRRCVTQLLRVAQPPFSDVFARALLAVLHLPHVINQRLPAGGRRRRRRQARRRRARAGAPTRARAARSRGEEASR